MCDKAKSTATYYDQHHPYFSPPPHIRSLLVQEESHKNMSADTNVLMRWYYTKRWVLFLVCAGNELFLLAWYAGNIWYVSMPKQLHYYLPAISTQSHLPSSPPPLLPSRSTKSVELGDWTLSIAHLVMLINAPIFLFKQVVSVIQWYTSMAKIAAWDTEQRAKRTS